MYVREQKTNKTETMVSWEAQLVNDVSTRPGILLGTWPWHNLEVGKTTQLYIKGDRTLEYFECQFLGQSVFGCIL